MIARHHAVPAQHPHIAERIATADRNRSRCANRQLNAAVGQRIPYAIEYFLKDDQFDVGKMAIEIDDHLTHPRRFHNIIHCDRQLSAPAVRNLLTLLAGDLHFFDNRAPFL